MRLQLVVDEPDQWACVSVEIWVRQEGDMRTATTYNAGTLYVQERDLRIIESDFSKRLGLVDVEISHRA